MHSTAAPPRASGVRTILVLAALALLIRLAIAVAIDPAYGFHRDELLYLAMADHLDVWRMQFPPAIAVVGRVALALFGHDSTWAARVPAAVGAAALSAVALTIAWQLGARRIGLGLVLAGLLASPVFVRAGVLFQPVVFDQLWFSVAALGLVLALRPGARDAAVGWLVVGTGLGLGALTKFSAAFYGVGIATAVLLVPGLRRALRTRWPYVAASIAAALALPSLIGQQVHGWPFLVQARQLREAQLSHVSASGYFGEQLLLLGGALPLAVFGVVAAVRTRPFSRESSRDSTRERTPESAVIVRGIATQALALVAAAVIALLFVLNGKAYYVAPVYVPLLAAGAAWLEGLPRRTLAYAVCGIAVASAALLLPAGAPVLTPSVMARYATRLGITGTNDGRQGTLPQDYADMIGWPELAAATASAWRTLPRAERDSAMVLAINYGRAGALARFGPALGLPYPVSPHGDFWAWGAGPESTLNLLVVGDDGGALREICEQVIGMGSVRNPLGVDEERSVPISYCRGLRTTLPALFRKIGPQWG